MPVKDWKDMAVKKGITVYHVTSPQHALSIIKNGIKPVQNAFGGGRLGSGFYTHQKKESAKLYTETESPVTLEFILTQDAKGQIAPQNVYVGTTKNLDYVTDSDFVTAEEDNKELKFHHGKYLKLVKVHQGNHSFTPEEYKSFSE